MDQNAADILSTAEHDIQTQMIILAAAKHDVEALRTLLRTGSANVKDPDTGYTPLHAAIAACETDAEGLAPNTNGHANGGHQETSRAIDGGMAAASKTVKLLFQNGAIWNDLDANDETLGCMARRLGLNELYELVVDAGVRAELLLNRMDEYQELGDEDGEDGTSSEAPEGAGEGKSHHDAEKEHGEERIAASEPSANPVIVIDPTNLVTDTPSLQTAENGPDTESFLSSDLRFSSRHILDSSDNSVMMAWESDIMERTANLIVPAAGQRILNVGHGMGIIDRYFQSKAPAAHHIIEAHPAVLQKMRDEGWYDKPNVVIHEGRWQDVAPQLVKENHLFDVIYFDTFAEDYKAFREFFSEYVTCLLDPSGGSENSGGRFSFFHGLGADRQVCYDVYTKIVEMDLFEAGFDTQWEEVKVPNLEEAKEWKGVKRPYWNLETYRLPTCTFIP